jgi:hypothetical protein
MHIYKCISSQVAGLMKVSHVFFRTSRDRGGKG